MRAPALLAAAAAILVALGAAAAPSARKRPPPPPPTPPAAEGETGGGLVTLRPPGFDAVRIPGGTFIMGSNELEIAHALAACRTEPMRDECTEEMFAVEYAPHEVKLGDYWLDRTEVTVARYGRCVAMGRCAPPPFASGGARFDRPDFPVTLVTWNEAATFCAWDGGRLPTEAEWERAARGLSGRRYPWGNIYNPFITNHGRFSWYEFDGDDGFQELAPVGSFPAGRTPDGIDDLAGNVEEWVADWFAPEYPKGNAVNPRGPDSGDERVVRGGGYFSGRPWLRGAARWKALPGTRRSWRGFRCARDR